MGEKLGSWNRQAGHFDLGGRGGYTKRVLRFLGVHIKKMRGIYHMSGTYIDQTVLLVGRWMRELVRLRG